MANNDEIQKLLAVKNLQALEKLGQSLAVIDGVKGEKGDKMTYQDLTQKDKADLVGLVVKDIPLQDVAVKATAMIRVPRDGKDGKNGKDGQDGITPVKGYDYFTQADKDEIALSVESQLYPYVDELATGKKLEKNIKDLGDEWLPASAIKGLEIEAASIKGIHDLLPKYPPSNAGGSGATFLKSMRDLDRTSIESATDGQALVYDSTLQKWKAGSATGGDSWRIIDADADTYVQVAASELGDEDVIRMFVAGSEVLTVEGGDVGINLASPQAVLDVNAGSFDPLSGLTTVNNYGMRLIRPSNTNNTGVGIAFTASTDSDNVVGAAIIHERVSTNSQGKLRFYTKQSTTAGVDPVEFLRGNEDGTTTVADAFTLPTTDGTSGQYLATNGSGTLAWTTFAGEITEEGTVKANTDILTITNSGNAVDMDTTQTSILFNQYYYDATTPASANSARITAEAITDWTSSAGSQDAKLGFAVASNGTMETGLEVYHYVNRVNVAVTNSLAIGTTGQNDRIYINNELTGTYGIRIEQGVSTPALYISSGTTYIGDFVKSASGKWMGFNDGTDAFSIHNNAGTPESVVSANIGSLCIDTTNGALYVKTTDTVSTGWSSLGGGDSWRIIDADADTYVQTAASSSGDEDTITMVAGGTSVASVTATGVDVNLIGTLANFTVQNDGVDAFAVKESGALTNVVIPSTGRLGVGVSVASAKIHLSTGSSENVNAIYMAHTAGQPAITASIGSQMFADVTRTSAGQWFEFDDGTDVWGVYNNAGTPESVITANIGSFCIDTTNGDMYLKTTDSVSTGWKLVTRAA